MLIIAAVTVFMSAPGQSFSVAAFVDPMLAELTADRTSYSVAYMTATLIGGLILPFVGRQVDRFGARRVLPLVALGLGAACGWMSQVAGLAGLYVGFTLIRCLGQGSLTLISNWIVGEWFHDFRGRAAGICAVGGTASVLIIPQVNDALIGVFGWRDTWLVLGGVVCVCLVIPTALFLRDRPEALGLLPDGRFPETPESSDQDSNAQCATGAAAKKIDERPAEQSYTVTESLKCSAFWKVAAVVATVSLVGTGLMFHQVSILAEKGVSRSVALSALGVQAIAATVSTLVAGWLVDRMPARFVLACSMLLETFALLLLMFLPSPNWVFVYSALLGLHGGIIRSVGSIVWINYFGRQHQGAIQGVAMSIMVIAAALGPVPAALAKDITGDYRSALQVFLLLPVMAGTAVLSATPPDRSTQGQVSSVR